MSTNITLTALWLIAFPLLAQAELPALKIVITGVDPVAGQIETTLFNSEESFMIEPVLQETSPVEEDGNFIVEFFGLEPGEYAVVVVHDENDNGVLDSGFLGFGGESIAYSNDVRPLLGRPAFTDVKFEVGEEDHQITITME